MISLRRALPEDADWLLELYAGEDVEPFMSPNRPEAREAMLDEVARSDAEPAVVGRFVIEADGERAGTLAFHEVNARSRIAHVGGLAVHPDFRGRRIADEASHLLQRLLLLDLGFHRIELLCYGFNERAIVQAERAGFVREGVKRRAYLRHGEWQDAVQFALLREDLDP